jgi:glycosyltransferase involved in cell wall biosynthesis
MSRIRRVLFFTSFEYPARYAHPIHALYMARAFTDLVGVEFLFILNATKEEALFRHIPYRTVFGRLGRRIKLLRLRTLAYVLWFPIFMLRHAKWRSPDTAVFVNDLRLGLIAAFFRPLFGYQIIFESHTRLAGSSAAFLFRRAQRVVFVTQALRQWTIERYPFLESRSLVAPNAVDSAPFEAVVESIGELRSRLSLPVSACLIGYLGRFVPGGIDKGVSFMITCLRHLPPEVHMLFVGGTTREVAEAEELATREGVSARTHVVAHVPSERIAQYAKACDILAYVPAPAAEQGFFVTETSPMKVFEYMAAQRPSIVADLPTTREILDEDSSWFVEPGSEESFTRAVADIRAHPEDAARRVARAFESATANTWRARAKHILWSPDENK